ncbi:MAG TPA: rRNA maturation RNase YbeY [Gammaproteobacteria bacterium]|nr:rRNA maturation RNase YbeY [Gammaproteobacteria bacterium]
MTIELELQIASEAQTLPHPAQFKEWIANTLADKFDNIELTIRIVDVEEMTELNETYRHKQGPTNVLSFPAEIDDSFGMHLLGDIIICAPVVQQEAADGNIDLIAHWAHMVVHGTLHLLGYDHMIPDDADVMEAEETKILTDLGYPAPYGDKLPHA